jgi:hypothetical protein
MAASKPRRKATSRFGKAEKSVEIATKDRLAEAHLRKEVPIVVKHGGKQPAEFPTDMSNS